MAEEVPFKHPASYKDPSGYIYIYQNEVYRQVNKSYQSNYEALMASGLYDRLISEGSLISHQEIRKNIANDISWFITLKPTKIDLVSYPYEWSFSMLKDAALLTLKLIEVSLEHGMILKDATPYNIQFHNGKMVFIDTLSFERYNEGEPWIAYRQFCENFIGPLALMHHLNLPMQHFILAYPDGIPLQYVKRLLPFKTKWNLHLFLHIHLHAAYSQKSKETAKTPFLSKQKLISLLKSLETLVSSFEFNRYENVWGKYYEEAKTRPGYFEEKKEIITSWLGSMQNIKTVLDIGGNKGEFSKLVSPFTKRVICADGEHYAIESLYKEIKETKLSNLIPLYIDFSNPSPSIGVNNEERTSFFQRSSSDLVLALAIIHHLAIGKNITFELIARMCARLGKILLIEFVKKEDEKAQLILQNKKDIYDWYNEENFLNSFSSYFQLIRKHTLSISTRTLFLMERIEDK